MRLIHVVIPSGDFGDSMFPRIQQVLEEAFGAVIQDHTPKELPIDLWEQDAIRGVILLPESGEVEDEEDFEPPRWVVFFNREVPLCGEYTQRVLVIEELPTDQLSGYLKLLRPMQYSGGVRVAVNHKKRACDIWKAAKILAAQIAVGNAISPRVRVRRRKSKLIDY